MKRVFCVLLAAAVSGCSSPMIELASPMRMAEDEVTVYRLEKDVTVKAPHAAPLTLRAGTTWRRIGDIEQGAVFDTRDQVVVLNSFDVHEAAIVTRDRHVVGFYLKVSETFVEAQAVPIQLQPGEQ